MSRDDQSRTPVWIVRCAVAGAWALFALMVLAITWGGAASRNRPFDLPNSALWNAGWVYWAGATFGVRALARRFPLERPGLPGKLLWHTVLGLVVTTGMLALEYVINDALQRLWPATIKPNPFVSFFVYKFHIHFLIYWLIVGASGAYDSYARLQRSELTASELKARLAQAQVQALRMQLQPHFLFNTHHAIISLMLKGETPAAVKMLTRLSDLLRATLKPTDQPMNSLREELDLLELYLGIQRERYRERLTVRMEIEPAVLTAAVPCLLLQPLVENALQHGIEALVSEGRLMITARRTGARVQIEVSDNGPGLPAGFAAERAPGIGLSNTRARLEQLYGAEQRCEIGAAEGGGARVWIELPYRELPPVGAEARTEKRGDAG